MIDHVEIHVGEVGRPGDQQGSAKVFETLISSGEAAIKKSLKRCSEQG